MSGGWFKIDKDLVNDPRLLEAAMRLGEAWLRTSECNAECNAWCNARNALLGALVTLWSYADDHIADDNTLPMTSKTVDTLVGLEGFCSAIPDAWLIEHDDGRIELPGYCEKNRLITKRKRAAKSNERVARWRQRNRKNDVIRKAHGGAECNAACNAPVTHSVMGLDLDKDLDLDIKNKKGPTDPVELALDGGVETGEQTPKRKADGAVDRIFKHWQVAWNKPRAKLDAKRRRVIGNALTAYSEADLVSAIDGYTRSPYHTGDNERHTVYAEISLFLRDAAHIDAGLAFVATRTNGAARPWNADRDLKLYSEAEARAYDEARQAGKSFASADAWQEFYRGRQN